MQSDGHAHLDLFLPILLLHHLGRRAFKLVAFTIGIEALCILPNHNVNLVYKCVQSTDLPVEGLGIGRLIATLCNGAVDSVPILVTWFIASTLPTYREYQTNGMNEFRTQRATRAHISMLISHSDVKSRITRQSENMSWLSAMDFLTLCGSQRSLLGAGVQNTYRVFAFIEE